MIRFIELVLVAHYPDRRKVEHDDFIAQLNLGDCEAFDSTTPGQSARVVLLKLKSPPFGSQCGALEQFESDLNAGLIRAAEWLASQPSQVLSSSSQGLTLMLLIDVWIDSDQMDLSLPPELLQVCGQSRLPIRLITND